VALAPALNPQRRLELHAAQLNVIRQEPNGFLTFNADTLSLDPDLLQINVRRLLHLLRRVALRLGADFVFEPHDETFRRMVRRSIEGVLGGLFARGAFVGRTPEAAYQVILRSTEQDVDQGRFLVDLKVAPALPMTFLTVRLVQVDGRTVVSEER
jgi:phage tail sheath protein FI